MLSLLLLVPCVSLLTFSQFIPLQDPVRPAVPQTVVTCHEAGITVKMVTGDDA